MSVILAYFRSSWSIYLYVLQILTAEILFSLPLKRRRRFWLRCILGVAAFIVIVGVIAFFQEYISGYITICIFLASFPLYLLLFENQFMDLLFCYVSALIAQNLAYSAGVLCSFACGVSPDFALSGLLTGAIQTPAYILATAVSFVCCHRKIRGRELGLSNPLIVGIAVVSAFFIFFLHVVFRNIGIQYFWPTTLLFFFCDVLLLFMLYGLFEHSKLKNEINILEQIMEKERKQYTQNRQTIEMINFKCHDIKHQIAALKASKTISDEAIDQLQREVTIYEQSAETGNPTLDIVISEKTLLFECNHITLTYMADGKELAGMESFDIASVFGNLLDNAMNYLLTVPEEKRNISLSVQEKNGFLVIHTENYCGARLTFVDGIPETTAASKAFHGYGLKSVKYIVSKYRGNMVIDHEGDTFLVDIIIPKPLGVQKNILSGS